MNGTLTGTITPGQSGRKSNGNEGVLHTPQISRTVASLSAALQCHIQNTPFLLRWKPYSLQRDADSVF